MIFKQHTPYTTIEIEVKKLGPDYVVTISGGESHVGSVVMSTSRPSLRDPNETSCTSSVLNALGHKDEMVCRLVAETLSKHYKTTVACIGGIHIDGLSSTQITQVMDAVHSLLYQMMTQ